MALLAMRMAINDLGVSPAMVMYGEQLALPASLITPQVTYDESSVDDF
jgi:hypothetical protein